MTDKCCSSSWTMGCCSDSRGKNTEDEVAPVPMPQTQLQYLGSCPSYQIHISLRHVAKWLLDRVDVLAWIKWVIQPPRCISPTWGFLFLQPVGPVGFKVLFPPTGCIFKEATNWTHAHARGGEGAGRSIYVALLMFLLYSASDRFWLICWICFLNRGC